MKVAILTALRRSTASWCLPALVNHPNVDVSMVVFCESHYKKRSTKLRRDFRKAVKIGPLGVLTGLMMRGWYSGLPAEDLFELCEKLGVRIETTPRTNHRRTVELLRESGAELGLSLGNAYIAPRVFKATPYGMINSHGEILPRFQGAASVIWAVYEGVTETGFTFHQVDRHIDTGAILYQERFPIRFQRTFRRTVEVNTAEIGRRVPDALARVVGDYHRYREAGAVQSGGRSYTTPTFWQYLRMLRRHRYLSRAAVSDPSRD